MTTPFVGESRIQLVYDLLEEFDKTVRTGAPTWVDISAPSGWGKTRILQEFFSVLSAQRQENPRYWPSTLIDPAGSGAASVLDDRKVLRPTVVHTPGSLPNYMWWAISCSRARGHQTTALANDLRQLVAHVPYLNDALSIRQGRSVKLLAGNRSVTHDILDVGAEEAATIVLETVLSSAVPGLGLVRPLAKAVKTSIAERRHRRQRLGGNELIVEDGDELVLGAVSLLQRLTAPGNLPCVIVVEDLHLADRELIALLEACVALESAHVMIVSTSWPGFVDDNEYAGAALATANDLNRLVAYTPTSTSSAGTPLGPLSLPDMKAIVDSVFPGTPTDIVDRLITTADTPLALMLTLDLPRFERFRGAALNVSLDDIPSESAAIADIVRQIWNEMPAEAQLGIGLAALSTPLSSPTPSHPQHDASAHGLSHLDEWDLDLVAESLSSAPQITSGVESAQQSPDHYAWSTLISPSLRRFRDPLYFDVASERIHDHLLSSERTSYRQALGANAQRRWVNEARGPQRESLAHLIVGLATSGIHIDGRLLAEAGLAVSQPLQLEPTSWPDAIAFCDALIARINNPEESAPLAIRRWRLAAELGDVGSAKRNLRAIVRNLESTGDPLLLAEAKHHFAVALANSGEPNDAVRIGEEALAVRRAHLGAEAEPTIRSLINVAWFTAMMGEHRASERELRDAVERSSHALGPANPTTIAATIAWAASKASLGQRNDAVTQLEALRRTVLSTIDRSSPIALILEYNVLVARSDSLETETAQAELEQLAIRARQTFGDSHPFLDELDESRYQDSKTWDFFVQLLGVRTLG